MVMQLNSLMGVEIISSVRIFMKLPTSSKLTRECM